MKIDDTPGTSAAPASPFRRVWSGKPFARQRMGIALRTTLLSWLVTSVTLLIFVTAIIPQQKRTFEENLRSKAHGVAVSLREVASSAALNDDYTSIVDHSNQILDGDRSIDYLVITKNDGNSQILQQQKPRWRSDQLDAQWRPEKREEQSGIGIIPLFDRRVFHYSQPFDYSGIQWGWIHVGLSLSTYDQSVRAVYWRTSVLAVICVLFGLLASVLYAKHLVKPILALQSVVHRVARGDLTVLAKVDRRDELGNLAESVNLMTQALAHKDCILQSVRFAAQEFLTTSDWRNVITSIIAKIGQSAEVSRLRIFENSWTEDEGLLAHLRYEWTATGTPETGRIANSPGSTLRGASLETWVKLLEQKQMIAAHMRELDDAQRQAIQPLEFKSILVTPIMVENAWWGFVTLADCQIERQWTDAEKDSLRAMADMLGAAIARQRAQDGLLEAKETLELRVQERTKELRAEVAAKDRAHAELAEAQQRLLVASREAGMAEVATGVLHNVGNVLNSINVSTTLLRENLSKSEVPSLTRLSDLLQQHRADLGDFLTSDPKGQRVLGFLARLSEHFHHQHGKLEQELEQLGKNVEHVKEIVAMQQSYARVSGVLEQVSIAEVVDDALQMNAAGLRRHGVQVVREYQEIPKATVDRHKVLQILVNLVHNAKYALDAVSRSDKLLSISIGMNGGGRVKVKVMDNGIGIKPENLTKIFSHGFTTRKSGHGFGLHSGANAAKEMGGVLKLHSEGEGMGVTATLELPLVIEKEKR
jgi:two-component system, NtrC family, sensor kinase